MRSLLLLIFIVAAAAAGAAQTLTGAVLDPDGSPVASASVILLDGNLQKGKTLTDAEGRFSLSATIGLRSRLTVSANGFAAFERPLKNDGVWDFTIVLRPAGVSEDVTISIGRTESRLSETPASVVALTRNHFNSTAAQTVDDTLRQVAGFTLFRRGSSKTTNPTAQGANLRGVSGSGASRASVLFDGLSLNDAFGGWTYWSRVPMNAVEQAEVLRGGASALYGSGGLSGAVNLVPLKNSEDGPVLSFRASAGSQNTYDGSVYTAYGKHGWDVDLAAETFQTGGYIPVAKVDRGIVDTRATSRHDNGIFSIERRFRSAPSASTSGQNAGTNGRAFFRGNLFDERRDNGTSLTYNKTYFRQAAGGADLSHEKVGEFRLRLLFESQVYDQSFSAVSLDRNTETLSRLQRVPSQAVGSSLFWTRPIKTHTLAASFETREVRGFSDEVGYTTGRPTSASGSGGSEQTFAFFLQDSWTASEKLNLNFGLRIDHWKNFDAHSSTRQFATNVITDTAFPNRDETAVSPRVAAIYRLTPKISAYGSYSRSFRAPTLNELYRGFRVGNVVTQANENLRAEYANTFEGGVTVAAFSNRLNLRGNMFATQVSDPVVSVTLSTTPTLITRQRQNVGKTRTSGLEVDAEYAIRSDLSISASYLLADSRVTDFPGNNALVDNFLPQIAPQQVTFQLRYHPLSRFSFGIQARASDGQWEDDLNTLRLRPYFTMDATTAYRIHKKLELFAAAENILNSRYDIGLTPVRTVAAPAFVRVGLRFSIGGK